MVKNDVESDMEEDDNISTTSDGCDTQSMCGSNEYEEDPDIAIEPVKKLQEWIIMGVTPKA